MNSGFGGRLRVTGFGGQVVTSRVPNRGTGIRVQRLTSLRRETYQVLATMLLYPEVSGLVAASDAAGRLRRRGSWATGLAFYGPWALFLDSVVALKATDVGNL